MAGNVSKAALPPIFVMSHYYVLSALTVSSWELKFLSQVKKQNKFRFYYQIFNCINLNILYNTYSKKYIINYFYQSYMPWLTVSPFS